MKLLTLLLGWLLLFLGLHVIVLFIFYRLGVRTLSSYSVGFLSYIEKAVGSRKRARPG